MGVENTWPRIHALGERLRGQLVEVGATVHDAGAERCGIVTFATDGAMADEIKAALARERINVTVSERSHFVVEAQERNLPDLVRVSVHYFNTEDELDRAVEYVRIADGC